MSPSEQIPPTIKGRMEQLMEQFDMVLTCKENEALFVGTDGKISKKTFSGIFSGLRSDIFHLWHKKDVKKALAGLVRQMDVDLVKGSNPNSTEEEAKKVRGVFFNLFFKESLPRISGGRFSASDIPEEVKELLKPFAFTQEMFPYDWGKPPPFIISEFNNFKINNLQLQITLRKVKRLEEALAGKKNVREADKLTFEDLKTIDRAGKLIKWIKLNDKNQKIDFKLIRSLEDGPFKSILFTSLSLQEAFNQTKNLKKCFFEGYQTGDVLFYDMEAKKKFGDTISGAQAAYFRFSHTGIYQAPQEPLGMPKVLHLVPEVKLQDLPSTRRAFVLKKEIDFTKVFNGFGAFSPSIQEQIVDKYRQQVSNRLETREDYEIKPKVGFFEKFSMFALPRKYTPSPELAKRKQATEQTQRTTAERAQHVADEVLCSGFAASLVYEAMQAVKKEMAGGDTSVNLEFTKEFSVDVAKMTPRDLHSWNIWKVGSRPSPNFQRIVAPEVLESSIAFASEG